ncbi:MAG: sulfatase [Dysgonamonadaceae bacterium]|jgi:arylsulfatase A-like enzyme|nr:sulfatase [Dysgonamonadaceae bacterium]
MKIEYPILFSTCLFLFPGCHSSGQKRQAAGKPNVLFICVDDLRRDLGCYGSVVKSPNIDKLAGQGSLFFNHYTMVPTSGAARAGMLTGKYPRETSDLSNEACRTRLSDKPETEQPETIFHHLRRNGYYTVGIGKISHYVDGLLYGYTDSAGTSRELPYSWDEMLFDCGQWRTGWNAFFGYADGTNRQGRSRQVKPYETADVPDEGYPDGLTARLAVEKIKELTANRVPFCLAVGFFKPHLPFTAPKKYWDLYERESIPLSPIPFIPEGCHEMTLHKSEEFNGYLLGEEKASLKKSVSDDYARKLRRAYFACISYVDAQIGKVLDALEESGQADNTIVILWGDHGWHLGDHLVWGKHTLHEISLNSTFIVKAPSKKKGLKNNRIVSSVDIYPTLMELCGVEMPEGLDGNSFAGLLEYPEDKAWKDVAYSYFRDGISMRTDRYRLSRYFHKEEMVEELYEYKQDIFERKNIADENSDILNSLIPLWEKGNTLGSHLPNPE